MLPTLVCLWTSRDSRPPLSTVVECRNPGTLAAVVRQCSRAFTACCFHLGYCRWQSGGNLKIVWNNLKACACRRMDRHADHPSTNAGPGVAFVKYPSLAVVQWHICISGGITGIHLLMASRKPWMGFGVLMMEDKHSVEFYIVALFSLGWFFFLQYFLNKGDGNLLAGFFHYDVHDLLGEKKIQELMRRVWLVEIYLQTGCCHHAKFPRHIFPLSPPEAGATWWNPGVNSVGTLWQRLIRVYAAIMQLYVVYFIIRWILSWRNRVLCRSFLRKGYIVFNLVFTLLIQEIKESVSWRSYNRVHNYRGQWELSTIYGVTKLLPWLT